MSSRLAVGAIATALTLGLAACGGESKPKPMDAVTKMQARVKTYKTIDLTLSGTQNQKPISMTLHGATTGSSSAGSITLDGQTAQIIQTGDASYIKAGADYFKQKGADEYSGMFADKWLKQTQSDNENFLSTLMTGLAREKPSGKANTLSSSDTKVTSDKLNGQSAWKLTTKDGQHTAWLKRGTFDLLKVTGSDLGDNKSDVSKETITVNKHDEPENITAPAGALDVSGG